MLRRRSYSVYTLSIILLFLFAVAMPAGATSDTERIERLERELKELKKGVAEAEAEGEEVRHKLGLIGRAVDVSGYADVELILTDQKEQNNRFRVRHLSLFFTKEIVKGWKLFTEIEYEDAPLFRANTGADTVNTAQGDVYVEQMYVEYRRSLDLDFRVGRVLTPAGIWSIYHYPPYVPTQSNPIMYKLLFPKVSDGLQVRKSFTINDSPLDTHLYVANGAGNPGRLDRNGNKAIGGRINYSIDLLDGLDLGGSFYGERDNDDIRRATYGAHLLLNLDRLSLQSEYAVRHNSPPGSGTDYDDKGLYAQLTYHKDRWGFTGRYDWFDENNTLSTGDRYRYTGAVNYNIAHNLVGKAELSRNNFDDPATDDYNELIFAIVVAIGDL
ncbi:MAG: hypothetical protein IME99_00650 [Proteobacteria bacterium]|nr:hypothetical protein [Pseudomonadota bacterium]